jgi:2-C-methyl-D-erythritol 4-phosphate cytidylyltransferase
MIIGLIVTAGQGTRLRMKSNKAFIKLKRRPLFYYSLKLFEALKSINYSVLIVHPADINKAQQYIKKMAFTKVQAVIGGGATRQDSVWQGLSFLKQQKLNPNDRILIHNGANPLTTKQEVRALLKVKGSATLAQPVINTIKRADTNHWIINTLPRQSLFQIQTPQIFGFELIYQAYERASKDHYQATDDAELAERLKQPVKIVPCSYRNFKITTREDLVLAEHLLKRE